MLQLSQLPANNSRTKIVFRYRGLCKKCVQVRGFLLYCAAIDTSAASNDITAWEFAKLNIEQKVENITQKWTVMAKMVKTDMSQMKYRGIPSEKNEMLSDII